MKNFADSVIYGNFYTVDEKNPKAQAVAINYRRKIIIAGNFALTLKL